jgi:hypothetical protein
MTMLILVSAALATTVPCLAIWVGDSSRSRARS